MLNSRARLMMVAVGFVGLDVPPSSVPPALITLHRWLELRTLRASVGFEPGRCATSRERISMRP